MKHMHKSDETSNVFENSVDVVLSNYKNDENIVYISGIEINTCTHDSTTFKDSVIFPPRQEHRLIK